MSVPVSGYDVTGDKSGALGRVGEFTRQWAEQMAKPNGGKTDLIYSVYSDLGAGETELLNSDLIALAADALRLRAELRRRDRMNLAHYSEIIDAQAGENERLRAQVSGDDVTGDQAGALDLDAIERDAADAQQFETDRGYRVGVTAMNPATVLALVAEVRRLRAAVDATVDAVHRQAMLLHVTPYGHDRVLEALLGIDYIINADRP